MSDDKDRVPGKVRRMEPDPIDKPKPVIDSWVKRFEHKAAAGAIQAHNEMLAAADRNRQLEGDLEASQTRLDRERAKRNNIKTLIDDDKADMEAQLQETENRKKTAMARANEVVADSEARKAQAVAAKKNAEADEMEAELRREEARLKLARLRRANPKDDFEELSEKAAILREEIETLTREINELVMKDDDTEAQSRWRGLDREKREKEAELADINKRLDELEGDAD